MLKSVNTSLSLQDFWQLSDGYDVSDRACQQVPGGLQRRPLSKGNEPRSAVVQRRHRSLRLQNEVSDANKTYVDDRHTYTRSSHTPAHRQTLRVGLRMSRHATE